MAAPTVRKMHTTGREFFFSARSTSCCKAGRGDCRPAASAHCLFFHWHSCCKCSGVRAGVLAHPPLLPTAGAPGTAFPSMRVEWDQLFGFTVPPLELVVRGTAMFLFLWFLFRVVIKRRVGAIGMADLLVLVIIADAAQNGMAGTYTSITDAFVVVGTIVLWNYLFDWLAFRSPALERLLEPPPLLVVEHGRILWRNMRLELLSRQELEAKLREHGVKDISEVDKVYVESDGEVSIIKRR